MRCTLRLRTHLLLRLGGVVLLVLALWSAVLVVWCAEVGEWVYGVPAPDDYSPQSKAILQRADAGVEHGPPGEAALSREEFLYSLGPAAAGGTLLAAVLACAGMALALAPLDRDVRRLAAYARGLKELSAGSGAGVRRQDELGAVAAALEQAVVRLHRALERGEEGTRVKNEFLARMSHEFRTPLHTIVGTACLALREAPDAHQRRCLESINRAATRLLEHLDSILDFSRIRAGTLTLESRDFNLREELQLLARKMADHSREKNISFTFFVEPAVPDWLRGDAARLLQICHNLCDNAVKFTDHGGVVLDVGLDAFLEREVLVHFSIHDTGQGISGEARQRIFEIFAQGDESTTRAQGGIGLGLSVARELVRLMRGALWMESDPAAGSSVHFTIPLGRTAAGPCRVSGIPSAPDSGPDGLPTAAHDPSAGLLRQAVAADPGQREKEPPRLLLVEDNAINREIALELFSGLGFQIRVAVNGAEALECCCGRPFDLVLMDIQMPVMDGLEAVRSIRASGAPGTRDLPIVALTANALPGDREKSLAAGMNDHLTKPLDVAELSRVLRRWLPAWFGDG